MAANIAKVVYFETWMCGHAVGILNESDTVDFVHLAYSAEQSSNEAKLQTLHGY